MLCADVLAALRRPTCTVRYRKYHVAICNFYYISVVRCLPPLPSGCRGCTGYRRQKQRSCSGCATDILFSSVFWRLLFITCSFLSWKWTHSWKCTYGRISSVMMNVPPILAFLRFFMVFDLRTFIRGRQRERDEQKGKTCNAACKTTGVKSWCIFAGRRDVRVAVVVCDWQAAHRLRLTAVMSLRSTAFWSVQPTPDQPRSASKHPDVTPTTVYPPDHRGKMNRPANRY